MAPSNTDTRAYDRQSAITNFIYFLAPKGLLAQARERRVLSPKAQKRRDAVNDLIYPFRPKSTPALAPQEPSVAEEVKATPGGVKKRVKKGRFALDEAIATPNDDEMKGSNPK